MNLEIIVKEFNSQLFRYGLFLTRNESEAADLTQKTFLVLAKNQDQVPDLAKIKFWLLITLRREFFNRINNRAAHSAFAEESHIEAAHASPAWATLDGRTALDALNKIEEPYRAVVELFYIGDLSYKEIGVALRIPVGTVMYRLFRGKERLKMLLSNAADSEQRST